MEIEMTARASGPYGSFDRRQRVSDRVVPVEYLRHLVAIGVARVLSDPVAPIVQKKTAAPLSASQPAPASPESKPKRRRGRPRKVICVNDAWRLCPGAEYLYACDERWWRHHWDGITFHGERWTQVHNTATQEFAEAFGLRYKTGKGGSGLGRNCIHHGGNSGYQAINLAYLLGAGTIILLGYDMGATGNTHFFGSHPPSMSNGSYKSFVPRFDQLSKDLHAEGVEVINCTPTTALTQFRRCSLPDALAAL
jgi:hypothetical protein